MPATSAARADACRAVRAADAAAISDLAWQAYAEGFSEADAARVARLTGEATFLDSWYDAEELDNRNRSDV